MADTIDVRGMADEDIRLLRKFAQFLREKSGKEQPEAENVKFGSWPLGVKGKLTREEIYDYL